MLEETPGKVVVLWDDGGTHRFAEVQTFALLQRSRPGLRRFPPCAPNLNPDGRLMDTLKNARLASFCPKNLEELEATVTGELRGPRRRQDDVMATILQTGLPIHTLEDFVRVGGLP